ncbi:MAG: flagellar basal body P-ring formation chaperone FlgA [Burkholderiales bacterium]|nr:flagellar basal body P-ring formation chaperone FlgA [Burkholderiales bacterium]
MAAKTLPLLLLRCVLVLGVGCAAGDPVGAQPLNAEALREAARRYLIEALARTDAGLRAQVEIGPLDPRLRLPPCAQPEFFLPPGARLQGHGSVGVRCGQAASPWTLYLGYRIHLAGPALVARVPLAARQTIRPEDVEVRVIAYERAPGDYLRERAQLTGAILAHPVAAGQALTIDRLSHTPLIRPGERVRLQVEGAGFVVSQEGTAQNAAAVGEVVRVRTDAGKIIQGVATADGSVRVRP